MVCNGLLNALCYSGAALGFTTGRSAPVVSGGGAAGASGAGSEEDVDDTAA